ncbi:MAG: hypothetical protein LWX54_04775 [Deltaproteobacteria bacterium]|nr:hypothetical protein [Deltaproteobacteria bacterium]
MRTIIKSLLCLALLMALIGTANAEGPPTDLIGSWQCKVGDDVVFLVNFNQGGTLTASGPDLTTSVYYGDWKRTGLNTFESKDFAFIIDTECILETDTSMTMSDNDNFDAVATISDSCNGTEVVSFTCTRTKI